MTPADIEDDPFWYKDAIIYELHIKAFFDSNADGMGDFRGLTQKLDYLRDLGITAIWLLPFYPSPLKDDGYDIADYYNVHPDYGTMKDFREFLKEAHRRGIRVITELVLNHTSDQHAWFQRARKSGPGSSLRNFYVWSNSPEKYADTRIIFQDFEVSNWTWDHAAKAYFWHRFYSHQPDLNFDNPQVRKAMFRVIDFWMGLGVDGVRLDAVPYLFEREGSNCENLPETHDYLRELRAHIDGKFKSRMLLAEANQWPEDAVNYFGHGDECHMAFHFPLMPRMFMALQMEDSYPILDILDQTPLIPDNCQWALFLRNHDELTLEMVTDEERDYMYRMYAKDPRARINLGIRRRLAPLVNNDIRKMKLLYTLLFTLPGTPVIYYGNEIGMGDNYYLGDRDGVRTPMQWSADKNAGFSRANPQRLYLPVIIDSNYHYAAVNVEAQESTRSSFLWWMRDFIALRKRYKAFGRGTMHIVLPDNPKIFAFLRHYDDETILVAVNLSRHAQVARFDLPQCQGRVPEEIFSKNRFMPIRDSAYTLTFGPYDTFIFSLRREEGEGCVGIAADGPALFVRDSWQRIFEGKAREVLEAELLPLYLGGCRWFGGKARRVQELHITDMIPIGRGDSQAQLLIMEVAYTEGTPDLYVLPLCYARGAEAERLLSESPQAVICHLGVDGERGVLFDALFSEAFCSEILSLIARRRHIRGSSGDLLAYPGRGYPNEIKGREYLLRPQILKAEQSNSSVLFGTDFFLKVYRHPDEGINPDLELSRFLTDRELFSLNAPAFAGGLEYRRSSAGEPIVLGILQQQVPNQGDAWTYYLGMLNRYFERLLTQNREVLESPPKVAALLEMPTEIPAGMADVLTDVTFEMVSLLGRRTAEMHIALASGRENPHFEPERFSLLWQRSIYQSMQSLTKRVMLLLRKSLPKLSDATAAEAAFLIEREKVIIERMRSIIQRKLPAMRIRIHGDYHLGQVLFTGKDYVIIDFEGEPARTLGERRLKRSPLRDVAGMLRSFHYAAYMSLLREAHIRPEDIAVLEPWADLWYRFRGSTFLHSYLEAMAGTGLIPTSHSDLDVMLRAFLLEKAVYELGYELNNRPEWISIPIRGIKHLLESE